ncbi:DUF6093 family protein [Streptomyces halobius]|uniref:DUF6093 family protein n=1 Tax=Streptomyces halobius TaxID=2879846 RepID=A0ABY4M7K8_9ACTN|nr:DUF6093 family protein [Streptomyces halobius]UQA93705.1 DUF6093 family protein [Streptomyces halobius]
MPLDQTGIARFAERHLMPDRVKITRGSGEDMLDPETGDLIPAPPLLVYADRAGLYAHQERIRGKGSHDGAWVEEVRPGYRMLMPLCAPEVQEDDSVLVEEARDEQAVGRTYRVAALGEVSSFPVLRTVWLEERNRKAAS